MNEIITINGKNYKLIEEVSKYAELLEKRRAYLHRNFGSYLETEAEQLAAVQQNGLVLKFINDQSNAVIDAALAENPDSYIYIKR